MNIDEIRDLFEASVTSGLAKVKAKDLRVRADAEAILRDCLASTVEHAILYREDHPAISGHL